MLNQKKRRSNHTAGFTLIEVLIVVAIIALLALLAVFMMTSNLGKSRDGRRKSDLARLKVAFEEYYGDENSYPPDNILFNCGGEELKPYLSQIPCDPKTNKPYCYIYDGTTIGQNFKILSSLEYTSDPAISDLNCDNEGVYCGYEAQCIPLGYKRFNYGVASSNVLVVNPNLDELLMSPSPTPTPSPSPGPSISPLPSSVPGTHACSRAGVCNTYSNPTLSPHFCPITFADEQCLNYCPTSPMYGRCAD